jgi:hypothetical protein
MTEHLPPTQPCTDPRHTGPVREQLGCTGPDIETATGATEAADRTAEQPFARPFRLHFRRQVFHGVLLPGGPALVIDDPHTGLVTAADDTEQLLAGYGGGHIVWAAPPRPNVTITVHTDPAHVADAIRDIRRHGGPPRHR